MTLVIVFGADLVIICRTMLALPQAVSMDSLPSLIVSLMLTITTTQVSLAAISAIPAIIFRLVLVWLIQQIVWR